MAVDQGIKSRPIYEPVGLDARGVRHLLVCDAPEVPAAGLKPERGAFPEVWTVTHDSRTAPSAFMGGTVQYHSFRSVSRLFAALKHRLGRETMGFRLYAVGSETFLADVFALGQEAGLGKQEIALGHAGSLKRRVYCVHCQATTEGVTTNLVDCSGCGATLFVRDHYSARLAAFMGVQADAEAPGELPPAETLYP